MIDDLADEIAEQDKISLRETGLSMCRISQHAIQIRDFESRELMPGSFSGMSLSGRSAMVR
jgi:hypothetical protein